MKRIAISRLPELLEQLAAQAAVYCPLDDGGGHSRFSRWEPGRKPVLTGNTRRGPKDLFFPQVEDLVRFRVSGKELEVLEARVRPGAFCGVWRPGLRLPGLGDFGPGISGGAGG